MANRRKIIEGQEQPEPIHKGGRGSVEINWKLVDEMFMSGANGHSIARALNVHHNTLYNHIESEKGMKLQQYKQSLIEIGNDMLQNKAFAMAMKGDKACLIFLLKARCGMSETTKIETKVVSESLDTSNLSLEEKKVLAQILEKIAKKETDQNG